MYVSEEHQFIYFAPPKTGTTAMAQVLVNRYGAKIWRDWKDTESVRKLKNGNTLKHVIHLPEQFRDYFIFATVRNPWKRIPSQYFQFKSTGHFKGSWNDYLKGWIPKQQASLAVQLRQTDDYEPPKGCVKFKLNAFIKLEGMANQFTRLPFVKRRFPFPVRNVKPKKFDSLRYTEEQAKMIQEHRALDFELFNYSSSFPKRMIRKAKRNG